MAVLRDDQSDEAHPLRALTRIGRAPSSEIVLEDGLVSGHHAEVRWTGSCWELRDLGSRNGTFHGHKRLEPRARVPLSRGDEVAFGEPSYRLVLEDDAGPLALAAPLDGGPALTASGGMLVLPNADTPTLTIYQDPQGSWVLERGGRVEAVHDGDNVEADGREWRVELPEIMAGTVDGGGAREAMSVGNIALLFEVSLDEETTDLALECDGERIAVARRVHHYLLLTLARERIRDARAHPKRPINHGWVHVNDLMRMLQVSENQLNLQIYRARKQLAKAGLQNAASLVERQPANQVLRIGVADCRIEG